jgi:hypothetical protein
MTARTYTRDRNGGTDRVVVDPIPAAGRVHVTSHYAGHQTSDLRRVSTPDTADTAAFYGACLLADGYSRTLRDKS